jgi:hypothetical protein
MNQLFFTLFCFAILLVSCKNEKFSDVSVCESRDPVNQVNWLKQIVKDDAQLYIINLYTYNDMKVVEVYPTYSSCMGCHYFTCEGERITIKPDDLNQLKKIKKIWPKAYRR